MVILSGCLICYLRCRRVNTLHKWTQPTRNAIRNAIDSLHQTEVTFLDDVFILCTCVSLSLRARRNERESGKGVVAGRCGRRVSRRILYGKQVKHTSFFSQAGCKHILELSNRERFFSPSEQSQPRPKALPDQCRGADSDCQWKQSGRAEPGDGTGLCSSPS